MDEKTIKVVVGKDYSAQVTAGNHSLIIDEPLQSGGKDLGPDPYSYILSALGACTAITVRMYADRKNWKLDRIEVTLFNNRVHPADCMHCEEPAARLATIKKEVKLFGDLTEEQIQRLRYISTKCPLQKTLEGGIHIETT